MPMSEIEAWFTYHAPTEEQIPKLVAVREEAKKFARVIEANVPASADRTAALRKLRECVMTANAAIVTIGHLVQEIRKDIEQQRRGKP